FAVAKTELSVFQGFLKRLGKLEQADEIGNARTVFAGASCNLLLGKSEFPAESFKSASLLHRVQVFALQVLDDGDLHRLLVGDLADGSGYGGSSGPLRGEPASLSRHEMESPIGRGTQDNRLNYTARAYGIGQLFEGFFVDAAACLVRVGIDQIERDFMRAPGNHGGLRCNRESSGQKRVEAPAQCFAFVS